MKTVFVHGWGLGPDYWAKLIQTIDLSEPMLIDLGFSGIKNFELPDEDYIFVTHSMGTVWALKNMSKACRGIMITNGFTRFTKTDGFDDALELRILKRMIKQFERNPKQVWIDFMSNAGMQAPLYELNYNVSALKEGLQTLLEVDVRNLFKSLEIPSLVLYSNDDQIVTKAHSRACFDQNLIEFEEGGHLLAQTQTSKMAQYLQEFLDQNA